MSSKPPRKGTTQTSAERSQLRQSPVLVATQAELLERPTSSSGLFSRAEAGKRLTATDISKLIRKAGMKPMGGAGSGEPETHVELSSAVPWVEGRGWLEAGGTLQNWFATTTIGFYPDQPGQRQGILSIWLDGLIAGDAYVVEIRVGGYSVNPQSPGTFHIGASDASHTDIQQSGASQTISVFIPAVGGTLSLINIETRGLGGWLFDDARVLHLGKLG
jgi:hypothetical protein